MQRRKFVAGAGLVGLAGLAGLAGCLGGPGGGGARTGTPDPIQVTTTGGEDVEILVAQVVIRQEDDGPRVHYRLRNDGGEDATVAVRTVLRIDQGGTYEATAYADVPQGQEVVLEYRVVRYDELTTAERENVRRGDADFDVYVNGEPRSGV